MIGPCFLLKYDKVTVPAIPCQIFSQSPLNITGSSNGLAWYDYLGTALQEDMTPQPRSLHNIPPNVQALMLAFENYTQFFLILHLAHQKD